MKWLPAVLLCLLVPLVPRAALACASCSCGDPTLTRMGAEQPYDGRLRLGASVLTRDEEVLDAGGNVDLIDVRFTATLAYALSERQMLSLALHFVYRHATQGEHEVAPVTHRHRPPVGGELGRPSEPVGDATSDHHRHEEHPRHQLEQHTEHATEHAERGNPLAERLGLPALFLERIGQSQALRERATVAFTELRRPIR